MGFRRGSRSSRDRKLAPVITNQPPCQDDEVVIQPPEIDFEECNKEADRQYVIDAEWHERKKARDQQIDKVREDKERRREALRQSRKAARREAANEVRRKRYEQRHPKPTPKDPRVSLDSGSYRFLGTNVNGDELRQSLGADGPSEPFVQKRPVMIIELLAERPIVVGLDTIIGIVGHKAIDVVFDDNESGCS